MHAPEMKAIQQRYKSDRQKQSEELMKFYKENKINPYAACLPVVFQIPIFISLFYVLKDFEKEVFPNVPGLLARLARARQHHRADEVRLGAGSPRRLRREPADVDVAHVDVHAEHVPARDDHGAPDRLHPLHPQIPLGPHDLLADDEPVDDGPGGRDPPPHAASRNVPPKRTSRTPSRDTPAPAETTSSPDRGAAQSQSRSGPPRKVKRKRGGRPKR